MRFTLAASTVVLAVMAAAAPQPAGEGMAVPLTRRSTLTNADGSVDVDSLKAHVASLDAKIRRGLSNFEKNTGATHPLAIKGVEKRGAGVPLTDDNNILWYGSIGVGTPAVTFTVDFDTGSSDLFLPGSNCDSSCSGHTIWNPASSSTSRDLGKTFALQYGDGSTVSGEQYSDTVSIAGLTATGQTLGAANRYSTGFQKSRFPADGLLGMAFETISSYPASPVFQTLIVDGQVINPVFSFKLSSSGAELYIGGSNPALYSGGFTYVPLTLPGFWQVNMDNIQGNGRVILSNVNSIVDTGTTFITGIPSQVASLYSALGGTPAPSSVGTGFYTFPCNSFPTISLTLGGKTFPILVSALNLGPVSPGSSDCVSSLIAHDSGGSFWIIGDTFLRGVYTAFDYANLRVGFAQLA